MKRLWIIVNCLNERIVKFRQDEKGQAFSEYAIVIGVVAILIIATLVLFKDALISLFTRIINALNGAGV